MGTILVVCTGNICRSPMAEGLLRRGLKERGVNGVFVESAGVAGWQGSPAMPEAVEALRRKGIDISHHRARRLEARMVAYSDLVLAMTGEHRDETIRLAPQAAGRTFTLKELVRLLDHVPSPAATGEDAKRLRQMVRGANEMRGAVAPGAPGQQDIADPLGLGVEAFQACAWELGELCDRLVNRLYPPGRRRMEGTVSDRVTGVSR